MQVKLHQRKSDKNNTELYLKAIEFFLYQLLPRYKREKVKLSVIIKNYNYIGEIHQISRNRYKVIIDKRQPFNDIITTLAHEMVHVAQGVKGKLIMLTTGFKWAGKLYRNTDDMYNNDYESIPWEKEALKLESELTEKFYKQILIKL